MANPNQLNAIIERIVNSEESESDISIFVDTFAKYGLEEGNVQSLLTILRKSKQPFDQVRYSEQKNINIIVQHIVQLGEQNINFADAKDFTIEKTEQGIDAETFKTALQEFKETILKIISEKYPQVNALIPDNPSYLPNFINNSYFNTNNLESQKFLPPSPPPVISIFEFEVVTVDNKGKITKRFSRKGECFTENLDDGVTLEMIHIKGKNGYGTFQMGTPHDEHEAIEDERPQHLVTVKDFFMGKYPITQTQWKIIATYPKIERDLSLNPSCFPGDNLPVERVCWHEAREFCARLSQKTRRIYRLPSEAEWEYACRAHTNTPFYFGTKITTDLANYCGQEQQFNELYRQSTTEVGIFPPNAFGLCDMHGNVWEWCADNRHEDYYGAPVDGSIWEKDGNPEYRMLRGGSWGYSSSYCRLEVAYKVPIVLLCFQIVF
ncbi:MAG: formylglycine-generating enzyme family protein [Scytonematopsis contorta HA4267-MV1]|jgi:formylglycine-generating enzyme required for sulfatase activity|nr:formylglycine-generating enzyme family protein [Scytonematopsis contorta HA4267-MV1]